MMEEDEGGWEIRKKCLLSYVLTHWAFDRCVLVILHHFLFTWVGMITNTGVRLR